MPKAEIEPRNAYQALVLGTHHASAAFLSFCAVHKGEYEEAPAHLLEAAINGLSK